MTRQDMEFARDLAREGKAVLQIVMAHPDHKSAPVALGSVETFLDIILSLMLDRLSK